MSQLRADQPQQSTPNFVEVLGVYVIEGAYPEVLLRTWDDYKATGRSENDRPDIFDQNQLFLVFVFGDGGCDLESFKFSNGSVGAEEAVSVAAQLVLTFAIAEMALEFEHRDLHIGNVLVKRTDSPYIDYKLNEFDVRLKTAGVQVFVIDFTNSRLRKEGCTIFTDLAHDDELFNGPEDEYQFEVYRIMKRLNGNNWKKFEPRTNLCWLHYILDKLIHVKRYGGRQRKLDNEYITLLNGVMEELLAAESCTSLFVLKDDSFPIHQNTFTMIDDRILDAPNDDEWDSELEEEA